MKEEIKNKKINILFSAIDQYVESNTIDPTETDSKNKFVEFGNRNQYPNFIFDCFSNSPTLKSIISSLQDFVVGNGVESNFISEYSLTNEKVERLVSMISLSYAIYGGFALNILRNKLGNICDIIPMDFRNIRSNKNNSLFYYSEYFGKKSSGRLKMVEYPAFDRTNIHQYSSIYYYKNDMWRTYPIPVWSASTNAALIESKIGEYHLNNLANGFSTNTMISMNSGIPTEEVQEQIEEDFNEKFCGTHNAGRVVIAFSPDKEHAPEVTTFDTTDFADKYNSLVKYSRDQLFTSFRMNPNLCGVATESNGFNSEEYDSSFKIFNRTVVKPLQKIICNTFDYIFGIRGMITIQPFTIEENKEKEVSNE